MARWTVADTEQSVPSRYEEQVRRQPDRPAIAGTSWQPTFAELGAAADANARALLERTGESRGRVALLMRHDAPLIAAVLGVLKAGQTAVVLNPRDPPARLDRIRRQVEPQLALVDPPYRELARSAGFADDALQAPAGPGDSPDKPPEVAVEPDDLAVVLYTSGSTGRPKGVMQTHRTLLHTALRHANRLDVRDDDRVVLLASPSGGQGMGTTWTTLLSGATLCPFPIMERGTAVLPDWLRENRITMLVASTSVFRHFVHTLDGDRFPDVRLVRLASEQVRRADFDAYRRHFGESCRLANVFSLTEAGGIAHCLLTAHDDPPPGPLPAGRPAEDIEILLRDERGEPVAPGETGEIFVRSRYLSPGYWRDDALTAERFADDGARGERTLRTGDLGRLDPDGVLTVMGRRDAQVKVRGHRVELAEVETSLGAHPQVEAAAACARRTPRGDVKLTAYVIPRGDLTPATADLRAALRTTLPDPAIPTAFAFVDEFPLNAHGKIDRERLGLVEPAVSPGPAAPAATDLERQLAEIWSEALEREGLGRDEDFFDLGGDSLDAAEIGAGVYGVFGVEIDLRAFAEHPTVEAMARLVERLRETTDESPPLVRAPRDQPLPCSFAQERIWRFSRTGSNSGAYRMAGRVRLRGPLSLEAMRGAIEHVVRRHEVLRTTFVERDGRPLQIVRPPGPVEVPLIDLSGTADPEAGAIELLHREAGEPFDLERGPLLRLRLVRTGKDDHRLLRIVHHIVSDGWSWRVFFTDLAAAYEALLRGEPPPDEDRLQYADYAVWERRRLRPEGRRYREEVGWWRDAFESERRPLTLPFARSSPVPDVPPSDGVIWWGLEPAVAEALDRVGREEGATHYVLRLAVFATLLSLEGGQNEIPLGAYMTNRRLAETQAMFGFFSNLTTLILPFDGRLSFRRWLALVRSVVIEASARSEVPYERLSEELHAGGTPPPEIKAIFHARDSLPDLTFADIELTLLRPAYAAMRWGFTFAVDQRRESDWCLTAFDARLYDPAEVRRFIERYKCLAEQVGAHPDRPLRELHASLE